MWAFFDFAVLIVAALLAVFGARSGLIVEIFRFASMAGGVFVSFMFYRDLQSHFIAMAPNSPETATAVTAFLVIFLAVSFAFLGLGLLLQKLIKLALLGWLDRTLGAILGLMKAAIIVWVACVSISSIPVPETQAEITRSSAVYRTFKSLPNIFSLDGMEGAREKIRGKRPEIERDIVVDAPRDTV